MERAEHLIDRRLETAVVALDEAVMQLMVEVPDANSEWTEGEGVVAGMRQRRAETVVQQHEVEVDRVERNQQQQRHIREQDHVLNRVHREARPWTDVGVPVMPGMHPPIEELGVQQSVVSAEVHR